MRLNFGWKPIKEYKEILFQQFEGIARISINRPEVHNAFTPLTVQELIDAVMICREIQRLASSFSLVRGG